MSAIDGSTRPDGTGPHGTQPHGTRRPRGRAAPRAWLGLCCGLLALAGPAAATDATTEPRPRIALVLSGGGARGLAHVGVIKALRELRVPVDLVVGTSMGAVVGGAFVAGHPVELIERMAVNTDWDRVFDPVGDRRDIDFRRRRDDAVVLPSPTLRAGPAGVTLGSAAFGSFELEMLLQRIAAPVRDTTDLDRLPIRYRSVAADLVTGERVLLQGTSLFTAMRASMSVPGAFAPLRVDGRLLVDGGIVRNLPVDVARELGADVVIAVNVGAPPAEESALRSPLDIALQMVSLLIQQNVLASLAQLRPGDVLVQPDLRAVGAADFAQARRAVEIGYGATMAQAGVLARFALPPGADAAWEAARRHPQATPAFTVDRIAFEGTDRTDPRGLAWRLPFEAGAQVDEAQLETGLRRLYASGDFDRIDYELLPSTDGGRALVLRPQERSGGLDTLRFGWQLQSNFGDLNEFNVAASYVRPWINGFGGEWRTLVQFGSDRRVSTELYQPLGRGAPLFASIGAAFSGSEIDVFSSPRTRIARVGVTSYGLEAAAGLRLGRAGELRLSAVRERQTAETLIGALFDGRQVGYESRIQGSLQLDALDSATFPRDGYSVRVGYARPIGRSLQVAPGDELGMAAFLPFSQGRHTVLFLSEFSRVSGNRGGVTLGGFLNLSGTAPGSSLGQRAALLSTVYFYQVAALPRTVGRAVYLGASLEFGQLDTQSSTFNAGGWRRANALLLGLDTLLGPLYLAVGHTRGGSTAFYLYVGRL